MEDWNGIDLSIYDEDGDIKTGNLTGNKVEITGLYGDLNIGCIESTQASLEAENGSVTVFAGTQGTLDVKNSYGDTNIYEMQKADAYGYDLRTEYGEIHFSGYEMMANENGDAAESRKQAVLSSGYPQKTAISKSGRMLRKALWKKQLQKQNL